MTKITTKSILKLDKEDVKKALDTIVWCTNEEFDTSLQFIWKEVVAWYALGVITDQQREILTKYREYREKKNIDKLEKQLSEKMMLLEQEADPIYIFQWWLVHGRIVVSSIKEEYVSGKNKRTANCDILEIYKSRTPKAYEYAKSHYQEYVWE